MLSNTGNTEASAKRDVAQIFAEIVGLEVGEAVLFSPTAILNGIVVEDADMNGRRTKEILPVRLGTEWVKIEGEEETDGRRRKKRYGCLMRGQRFALLSKLYGDGRIFQLNHELVRYASGFY